MIKKEFYQRVCKRCDGIFYATGKNAKICSKCLKPSYSPKRPRPLKFPKKALAKVPFKVKIPH